METFVAELNLQGICDDNEGELKDCDKKAEFNTQNLSEHSVQMKM
jgi:hypothetical protein